MIRVVLKHLVATPRRRERLRDLGFAIALLGLIWLAYSPSQKHTPRADHWCFLIDTMEHSDLGDSITSCYSYNRTRTVCPGDTDLFRPVLFTLLATEQWCFASDLWVYQTIGIVLHGAVCLLLFGLLRKLAALAPEGQAEPSSGQIGRLRAAGALLPHVLTAFFALNPAVQELVIWTHLHGYLLFLILLFGSLNMLVRHAAGEQAGSLRSGKLWGAWFLALVAAFTYEMGQFYAVLAGIFLAVVVAPRVGVARSVLVLTLFAAIMPTYQIVNRYDLEFHRGKYVPDNAHDAIREQMFTPATVEHSLRFAVYTGVQPFFPSLLHTSFDGGRLHIVESLWTEPVWKRCGPMAVVSAGALTLAVALTMFGSWSLAWRRHRLLILTLLLLTGLYGIYGAMTVLGRMNLRPGLAPLMANSYYTYTAFILVVSLLFGVWQAAIQTANRIMSVATRALFYGLVILTFHGAEQVWLLNREIASDPDTKDVSRPVRAASLFVKTHRDEPDFSFAIDYDSSDDVPEAYNVRVTHVIFHRWISDEPKYWIAIRDGKVVLLPGRPPSQKGDADSPSRR